MKRNIITAAIAAASALIATEAGAANLVTNGDFDNIGGVWSDNTGDGSNDFKSPGGVAVPAWSNVTGFANEFWVQTPNGYSGLTASPGNGSIYFVDLTGQLNSQPFGGLEQTISTTPGVSYMLTFACLMTFRAEKARRTAERGWLPSRQRRGSDREYADRLTGRARV